MNQAATMICLIVLMSLASNTFGQPSELGVYVTVKIKKKCTNQVLTIDNKKYCLANQPVLTKIDFAYITEMKVDLGNQDYFSLGFTEAGASKLRNLSIAYPNTEIVLVIDKLIIGFLTNIGSLRSNQLKMTAGASSGSDIRFIHEKFKLLLPVRK